MREIEDYEEKELESPAEFNQENEDKNDLEAE